MTSRTDAANDHLRRHSAADTTPRPGQLDGDQDRSACTAGSTKRAYRSYVKGIANWIRATQQEPQHFFEEDGSISLSVFSAEHFEAFLLHKMNGRNLKVSTLSGYRSAVKDMYRQKRLPLPVAYQDDMKTFFTGLKRVEADNDQEGRGRLTGKEPLTFWLYCQLAEQTLHLVDNWFAHLFLLSRWNLMCRSKSVETLHLSHLQCADDSVGWVLHKTKTNQEGSGPKDPRHIYANPTQPACCWVLTLGLYLAANPTLSSGKLFPGSNQKSRFCKSLGKMLEVLTGHKVYGTHSIRKGVATYASSGSTGGPSIVSVCLRCGWSLGGVQDRYFRYEAAGDQYLGRVVAGLPQNSRQFAALPPHIVDPTAVAVEECIELMFPAARAEAHIAPILQLCLASLVKHADYLRAKLKETHPVFSSYVFRQPDKMATLQVMLIEGRSSTMRPTGIPPLVELFQQHAETRQALNQLPGLLLDGFTAILEEKCVTQQSLSREALGATIKTLLEEAGLWQSQSRPQQTAQPLDNCNGIFHWPSDGRFHRMPETLFVSSVGRTRGMALVVARQSWGWASAIPGSSSN